MLYNFAWVLHHLLGIDSAFNILRICFGPSSLCFSAIYFNLCYKKSYGPVEALLEFTLCTQYHFLLAFVTHLSPIIFSVGKNSEISESHFYVQEFWNPITTAMYAYVWIEHALLLSCSVCCSKGISLSSIIRILQLQKKSHYP